MTYEVAINMHIGDDGDIETLIKRFHYHSKRKHVIYTSYSCFTVIEASHIQSYESYR